MKLIYCKKCGTLTSLVVKKVRYCKCKKCCGKYLADTITSVINKDSVLVGIDNFSFGISVRRYDDLIEKHPDTRIDSFFTGWIPNLPGESITVETKKEVNEYPFEEYHNTGSTMPNSI